MYILENVAFLKIQREFEESLQIMSSFLVTTWTITIVYILLYLSRDDLSGQNADVCAVEVYYANMLLCVHLDKFVLNIHLWERERERERGREREREKKSKLLSCKMEHQ